MLFTLVPTAKARIVLLEPSKSFIPSAVTYTNKTIHFQDGDPYEGYSYWTYELGGTLQTQSDNRYAMNTAVSGYAEYFGFDEFVEHSVVSAQIMFETTLLAGTYHFQPLGYFYQKTALESNTHWALVINWDAGGLDLFYNTGNGNTPTSVNLVATAPSLGTDYQITLSNLGTQTFVEVQEIPFAGPPPPVIYSGYTTTETYDATALYAGFGQYSSGDGNIYGWWDDLCIIDSTFTYPEDGMGFDRIDAYVDEVFAQTLYDMDEGLGPTLEIDVTATNITLLIGCWLNSTIVGVTLTEGKSIIRQNITVVASNGTIVFSQNNLTWIASTDYGDDVFLYLYSVELDFTIIMGEIYTVTITYEAWW